MPKYYVAGIPFDSENALMHYGVKGMKWDKHMLYFYSQNNCVE